MFSIWRLVGYLTICLILSLGITAVISAGEPGGRDKKCLQAEMLYRHGWSDTINNAV